MRRWLAAVPLAVVVLVSLFVARPVSAEVMPPGLGQQMSCNFSIFVKGYSEAAWIGLYDGDVPQPPYLDHREMVVTFSCFYAFWQPDPEEPPPSQPTYMSLTMRGADGPTSLAAVAGNRDSVLEDYEAETVNDECFGLFRVRHAATSEVSAGSFQGYFACLDPPNDGVGYNNPTDASPVIQELDGSYQTPSGSLQVVQARTVWDGNFSAGWAREGADCADPGPSPFTASSCPEGGLSVGGASWTTVADPWVHRTAYPAWPAHWPASDEPPAELDNGNIPPPIVECSARFAGRAENGRSRYRLLYRVVNETPGASDELLGWHRSWAPGDIDEDSPVVEVPTDRDVTNVFVRVVRTVEPGNTGEVGWEQNNAHWVTELGIWVASRPPGEDSDLQDWMEENSHALFLDQSDQTWGGGPTSWASAITTCVVKIDPRGAPPVDGDVVNPGGGSLDPRPPWKGDPEGDEGGGGGGEDDGCDDGGSWLNPSNWLDNVVCGLGDLLGWILDQLVELFIPDPDVIGEMIADALESWGGTEGPFAFVFPAIFELVGGFSGALDTAAEGGSCQGPEIPLDAMLATLPPVRPLDVCEGSPLREPLLALRVLMMVGLGAVTVRRVTTILLSSIGVSSGGEGPAS